MSIEGRELEIVPARKRIGAFIIDDFVVSFLFIAIFWEQLSMLNGIEEINQFLTDNFFIIISIKVFYHTLFVWQNGMTLGKYLLKMRVVLINTGHTPPLSNSLLRAMVRVVSDMLFYIGFLMAFFNQLSQTLHDRLSGCVVVDA
jgi:uncharacterized RDD family membrane protein YckC